MTRTRFDPLGLDHIGSEWSFFDCSDPSNPSRVGPVYKTKLEAFADLPRYAAEYGIDAYPHFGPRRAPLVNLPNQEQAQ